MFSPQYDMWQQQHYLSFEFALAVILVACFDVVQGSLALY
jgi:hypothetical protein